MRMQCKEAGDTKDKLNKVYQTNRDLVTRKCGLESAVQAKDKMIQELKEKHSKTEHALSDIQEKQQSAIYN